KGRIARRGQRRSHIFVFNSLVRAPTFSNNTPVGGVCALITPTARTTRPLVRMRSVMTIPTPITLLYGVLLARSSPAAATTSIRYTGLTPDDANIRIDTFNPSLKTDSSEAHVLVSGNGADCSKIFLKK